MPRSDVIRKLTLESSDFRCQNVSALEQHVTQVVQHLVNLFAELVRIVVPRHFHDRASQCCIAARPAPISAASSPEVANSNIACHSWPRFQQLPAHSSA